MKTVQAKFWVSGMGFHSYQPGQHNQCSKVKLQPVFGPGNEAWSEATPQGEIELTITNQDAVDLFEPGAEYKVTFEKV